MSIGITDKFKPKNGADFALMDAEDVAYKTGRLTDFLFKCLTEEEYNALKNAGQLNENTPYLIIEKVE